MLDVVMICNVECNDCDEDYLNAYTDACGFFLEKSHANPRSDILTWPCSSSKILAGCWSRQKQFNNEYISININ